MQKVSPKNKYFSYRATLSNFRRLVWFTDRYVGGERDLEKEIPVCYYPGKGGTVRGNCGNGNLPPITVIYRGNSKINGDFLGGKLPGNVGNIFFPVIYVIS